MSETTIVAIISAILTALVTVSGYVLTRKGTRESALVDQRRVDIEGLSTAVGALKDTIAVLEGRVSKLEHERGALTEELAEAREYIQDLIEHIEAELPPPPPARRKKEG